MSTYPLFNSFPPEIHTIILKQCSLNDRTCLRLTCKYLYNLLPPSDPTPLENARTPSPSPPCTRPSTSHLPSLPPKTHQEFPLRECGYSIKVCHTLTLTSLNHQRALQTPPLPPLSKPRCRTPSSPHCPCFSAPPLLHQCLASWVPRNMRYCAQCVYFTKRKNRSERCKHTSHQHRHRRRNPPSNLWTNRKGRGGYHRQLWKKWFNNPSWERLETRLRSPRTPNPRYHLREYHPRLVNTYSMRHEGRRGLPTGIAGVSADAVDSVGDEHQDD